MASLQDLVNAARLAKESGNIEVARTLALELQQLQEDMTPGRFPPGPGGQSVSPAPDRPSLPAIAVSSVIDVASLPAEGVAAVTRAITGEPVDRPPLGRQRLRKAATDVGLPLAPTDFEPEGTAEELTRGAFLTVPLIPVFKGLSKGLKKAGAPRLAEFLDPTGGRKVVGTAVLGASGAAAEFGAARGKESAKAHGRNVMASELTAALFFGAGPAVLARRPDVPGGRF